MFLLFATLLLFPISFSAGEKISLCSCAQADKCADLGFQRVDECKKECAHLLGKYATEAKKEAQALTGCFWKQGAQLNGEQLNKCMRKTIPEYCTLAANSSLETPDYSSWMESIPLEANATAGDQQQKGGAFMRKTKAAFVTFRNFQKCMNNCAKKHSTECFKSASCAVQLSAEMKVAQQTFNECTQQNFNRNARDSCRCLIQKHKVYQLVGVCPLFANTYLMRAL